jgi:hypothetical protein
MINLHSLRTKDGERFILPTIDGKNSIASQIYETFKEANGRAMNWVDLNKIQLMHNDNDNKYYLKVDENYLQEFVAKICENSSLIESAMKVFV